MAKKVIEVEVQTNIPGTINELKALKRELRNAAAGTPEFRELYNQIDDLEEKIKGTKNASSDWVDSIASAPGPLGMLGNAINSAKTATTSFGGALKATGIGIIVLALGGLYKAFSENENAMKKIQPLLDGLEKAFSGVFRALEPVFNALVDMAVSALPAVTTGIGLFYSAVVGLFTFVREAGAGYINTWKGILTLDFDKAKEGVLQMKDSFATAVKAGEEAYKRFEAGSKEQTKGEKESSEERRKNEEAAEAKRKEGREKARETRKKEREKEKEDEIKHAEELKNIKEGLTADIENFDADTEQKQLALRKERELRDIKQKIKEGDNELELMQLFNYKYNRLESELFNKTEKLREEKDQKLEKLLNDNVDKMLDIKGVKNIEELDIIEKHNQEVLERQKSADINTANELNGFNKTLYDILNRSNDEKKDLTQEEQDKIREIFIKSSKDTAIIEETYAQKKLDSNKLASDARIALAKEEADKIQAVDDAVNAAKRKALDTGLEILSTFFSKNKAVALSILAIQKGLAIADVVVGASKSLALQASALATANTAALATPQAVLTSGASAAPVIKLNTALAAKGALITKITAATSIASILASGITAAGTITAAGPSDTGGGGGGGATTTVTPPNYTVVGTSPTNLLTAQAMANGKQSPLRAYVVANDVTSAQALDRNIITSATIG